MFKRFLLSIIILFVSINTLAKADERILVCTKEEAAQRDFAEKEGGPSLHATSVFDDTFGGFIGTPAYVITGNNYSGFDRCTAQRIKQLADLKGISGITLDASCAVEEGECENMGLLTPMDGYGNPTASNFGNLLGMTSKLETSLKDPVPLSLAYYLNQNAQKVPLLKNTAFAQEEPEYGGPFLGAIYRYWTISRNIAYAFLALAMMVVGILIITRQKIDAKASVTVQQALPQIVIALILITFSYPIGATGASLAYNIRGSLDGGELLVAANGLDVASVSVINGWGAIGGVVTGIFAGIMALVSTLISVLMGLQVLLKIFGIYLKMLFATITAPLSFAIGAIPGNQNTTVNWFKQYGAYIVALPATSFGAWLVFGLVWDVFGKTVFNFNEFGGWGFGFLAGIALPAITFYGFSIVLTIPDKIEEMFGIKGGKK